MFRCKRQIINALETCQRHVPTLWRYRFWKFDAAFYQENILSSGVFRRETASGFYPWGKVDSPRKRVAEGLCGWRHGNSFPMTQSAQLHRQMRSIPLCPKAVFYVFVFGPIHDSTTLLNPPPPPSKKTQGLGRLGVCGSASGVLFWSKRWRINLALVVQTEEQKILTIKAKCLGGYP